MPKFNAWAQKKNPNFSIVSAQARVHPDDNGGWFMAQQILSEGSDCEVRRVTISPAD